MKPKNFPERKRQRQLVALNNLQNRNGNAEEISTLLTRTSNTLRSVRTKKRGPMESRKIK